MQLVAAEMQPWLEVAGWARKLTWEGDRFPLERNIQTLLNNEYLS